MVWRDGDGASAKMGLEAARIAYLSANKCTASGHTHIQTLHTHARMQDDGSACFSWVSGNNHHSIVKEAETRNKDNVNGADVVMMMML
jgi:hypothetical protein